MEKARYNTELYSNLRVPLNNVRPSNFWGAHQNVHPLILFIVLLIKSGWFIFCCNVEDKFFIPLFMLYKNRIAAF